MDPGAKNHPGGCQRGLEVGGNQSILEFKINIPSLSSCPHVCHTFLLHHSHDKTSKASGWTRGLRLSDLHWESQYCDSQSHQLFSEEFAGVMEISTPHWMSRGTPNSHWLKGFPSLRPLLLLLQHPALAGGSVAASVPLQKQLHMWLPLAQLQNLQCSLQHLRSSLGTSRFPGLHCTVMCPTPLLVGACIRVSAETHGAI